MTNETMNLKTLIEKTPDADLLRDMIGFAAERLMDMEVAGLIGAAYGEKSPLQHRRTAVAAHRADEAIRPAPFKQEGGATRLVGELLMEFC
jgi:hypothetical protein